MQTISIRLFMPVVYASATVCVALVTIVLILFYIPTYLFFMLPIYGFCSWADTYTYGEKKNLCSTLAMVFYSPTEQQFNLKIVAQPMHTHRMHMNMATFDLV